MKQKIIFLMFIGIFSIFSVFSFSNIAYTQSSTNWLAQNSGTTNYIYSMQFIGKDIGWGATNGGTLVNTLDGGKSWTKKTIGSSFILTDLYFLDNTIGWVTGNNGYVYKTIDSGISWTSKSSIVSSVPDYRLNSIHFTNANNGLSVGYYYNSAGKKRGLIIKSTNGGDSWIVKSTSAMYYEFYDVRFVDSDIAWIVGAIGSIYKSTNGGETWVSVPSGVTNNLRSVYFIDKTTGYVVGDGGVILKTVDGGNTWIKQTSNIVSNIRSVYFLDSKNGFVAGDSGIVLSTIDGGVTWIKEAISSTSNFYSVYFFDSTKGWVSGSDGTIFTYNSIPLDITPPKILSYDPKSALSGDISINLVTDEDSTCKYSETPNIQYSNMFASTSDSGKTHIFSILGVSAGNNNYYVRCKDNQENENTQDYIVSIVLTDQVYSIKDFSSWKQTTIKIYKGWNLVSSPYKDFSSTYKGCEIKTIYHYNSLKKTYEKFQNIEDIIPGIGYWIYSGSDCDIVFSGQENVLLSDLGDEKVGKLTKGWNQLSGRTEVISLLKNNEACGIKNIYTFDNKEKIYIKTENIETGKAYFVQSSKDCDIGGEDIDKRLSEAIIIVSSADKIYKEEASAINEIKKSYKKVNLVSISDLDASKISRSARVFVSGYSSDELSAKKLASMQSSGKKVELVSKAKQYTEVLSKKEKYKKYSIKTDEIIKNLGLESVPESFTIKNLIKDKKGNLYIIFSASYSKMMYGIRQDLNEKPISSSETFTVFGAAISKDGGETWKYVGRTTDIPKPLPINGVDHDIVGTYLYGIAPSENKGINLFYLSYRYRVNANIPTSIKEAKRSIYSVHVTDTAFDENLLDEKYPNFITDPNSYFGNFLAFTPFNNYIYSDDNFLKFFSNSETTLYFYDQSNLFRSSDGGKTIVDKGYFGYTQNSMLITSIGSRDKAPMAKIIEDSQGNIYGVQKKKTLSNGVVDKEIYNLYIKKGNNFEDTVLQVGYAPYNSERSALDLLSSSIPVLESFEFDSEDNLHFLTQTYSGTSPDFVVNINYNFIPYSKISQIKDVIKSVEIVSGSICNDCPEIKSFLTKNNIAFKETKDEALEETIINIDRDSGSITLNGFDKYSLIKALGIEIRDEPVYSYTNNLKEFYGALFKLDLSDNPYLIIADKDGLYKYVATAGSWNKLSIFKINLLDNNNNGAFEVGKNFYDDNEYLLKRTSDSSKLRTYDLYSTEAKDLKISKVVSQLIPNTVFYLPLKNDDAPIGKVTGDLSDYVTEEGVVEKDREKFYKVTADIREKETAMMNHIISRKIQGSLELRYGYATLELSIKDQSLASIDSSSSANSIDMSSQIAYDKNKVAVANNLGLDNAVCGVSIPANSYKVFDIKDISSESRKCMEANSVDAYVSSCDDYESLKTQLKESISDAYSSSIYLYETDGTINTNGEFKTYIALNAENPDTISCKPDTYGTSLDILEISGNILSDNDDEYYNPSINLIKVA